MDHTQFEKRVASHLTHELYGDDVTSRDSRDRKAFELEAVQDVLHAIRCAGGEICRCGEIVRIGWIPISPHTPRRSKG